MAPVKQMHWFGSAFVCVHHCVFAMLNEKLGLNLLRLNTLSVLSQSLRALSLLLFFIALYWYIFVMLINPQLSCAICLLRYKRSRVIKCITKLYILALLGVHPHHRIPDQLVQNFSNCSLLDSTVYHATLIRPATWLTRNGEGLHLDSIQNTLSIGESQSSPTFRRCL